MKVKIGAITEVLEATIDEKNKIKDDLTLLNPAYVSAKKFSSYSRIAIPSYLQYFTMSKDGLIIPRGYKIKSPYEVISDDRFTLEDVEYPRFKLKLRDTQKEAVQAYLKQREEGNGVIVLPTGKGKSILGLYLAFKLKQKCLVIVHKDDLINGWRKDCRLSFGLRPKQVGLIKSGTFRLGRQITLATIQTLSRLDADALQKLYDYFSMIIVDEFHHSSARIYEIVNNFPAKDRIGLTATDMRTDGLEKVLNFYFGNVCYRFKEVDNDTDIISPKKVIIVTNESNISYNPPTEYTYPNSKYPIDYIKINDNLVRIKDLDRDFIERLIAENKLIRKPMDYKKAMKAISENLEFNLQVAKDVRGEYEKGKSCLVFCFEKEHCRFIRDILIGTLGLPENQVQLYYGDSMEKSSTLIERAESKECLITIATYSIATEGTNVKSWERLFLAMTIGNEKNVIQAIGRGRRTKEGKTNLIVYDYRFPNVKGIRNHSQVKDRVYLRLGFSYQKDSNDVPKYNFKRGF
jgi:superfamily II DNA or RNA helicase